MRTLYAEQDQQKAMEAVVRVGCPILICIVLYRFV